MAANSNGQTNGLYSYDSFAGKRTKSEKHFLWWCAGAHQELLKEKTEIVEPIEEISPLLAKEIPESLPDDRHSINSGDKVILIVEDDRHFAKALLDYARQKRYKVIHSVWGDEVMG